MRKEKWLIPWKKTLKAQANRIRTAKESRKPLDDALSSAAYVKFIPKKPNL